MPNRLVVEELSAGRVQVGFRRGGQDFNEGSGEPVAFVSPFGAAEREELRWYLEDYLIAPYAVYEQRGQAVSAKLPEWAERCSRGCLGPASRGEMLI